jgi:hypothetical protein
MSLTLFAAIAAASAALGWGAGRLARRRAASPSAAPRDELPWRLPVALGDVLVRSADDEALLESARVLRDGEHVVAVVFSSARRGRAERVVVAFPRPSRELWWLEVQPVATRGEPPTTLESGGATLPRTSRVVVSIESDQGDVVGTSGVLALYRDASDRAALVLRGATTIVATGDAAPIEAFDRLPGRLDSMPRRIGRACRLGAKRFTPTCARPARR